MDTTRPSLLLRVRDPADTEAWSEFDTIYRPLLDRFARSCGLGHADAEDVVQDCMSQIHKHIFDFCYDPAKGRFKGWLKTVVNNRVRKLMRKRPVQQAKTHDLETIQQTESSPETAFDRIWREEHLKHALRLVQQEVELRTFLAFQRYVVEERSVEEVCGQFDLKPNALYAIKWRLTHKLREKLELLLDGLE